MHIHGIQLYMDHFVHMKAGLQSTGDLNNSLRCLAQRPCIYLSAVSSSRINSLCILYLNPYVNAAYGHKYDGVLQYCYLEGQYNICICNDIYSDRKFLVANEHAQRIRYQLALGEDYFNRIFY